MKMKKHLFVFIVSFIISLGNIHAQDFDLPSDIPEVMTYFYTEALSFLDFLDKTRDAEWNKKDYGLGRPVNFNSIPFFFSAYGRGIADDELGPQYNGIIGSNIRFGKYLSMPLFFSASGGSMTITTEEVAWMDDEKYFYHNLFTGGGLVLSTKYGTLGAFAGYYKLFSNANFFDEMGERPIRYGLIPVLDVSKYPVLKYVLKTIENYLGFDFHESKLSISGTTTKVISKPINIIANYFGVSSIYYYYSDEYINMALKNRIHGGGITLEFFEIINAGFEIGNRDIYETVKICLIMKTELLLDQDTGYISILFLFD